MNMDIFLNQILWELMELIDYLYKIEPFSDGEVLPFK